MSIRLDLSPRTCRFLASYSMAMGLSYLAIGSLELLNAICSWFLPSVGPLFKWPGFPTDDLFGALSSMVIGLVFLYPRGLWRQKREDIAFVLVGTLLASTFGVIYILALLAQALSSLLAGGGFWMDFPRPEIWLFLCSLPLAISSWHHVLGGRRRAKGTPKAHGR